MGDQLYFYTFNSGYVLDVLTMVVHKRRREANCSIVTSGAQPLHHVLFLRSVPSERRDTFDEARVHVQIKDDQREEHELPPDSVIRDHIAVDMDAEHDCDLGDISPFSTINLRSDLHRKFSILQERCHLYCFYGTVTLKVSFQPPCSGSTLSANMTRSCNN